MKHGKHVCKLNRNSSHRRCLFANMLKSLITNGRIKTTIPKAKELRRYADKMITISKKNTLHAKRLAVAKMMIRPNFLTPRERKEAKENEAKKAKIFNSDRFVLETLFNDLRVRFEKRNGGYTRIIKKDFRVGDNAGMCFIEFVE